MQPRIGIYIYIYIRIYIYLYDHVAGDKEVGGGEEDPKRVCVTRGKTMQKSKYGTVLNSNHPMESKNVLAIYVNQIGLLNAYEFVCPCACVF